MKRVPSHRRIFSRATKTALSLPSAYPLQTSPRPPPPARTPADLIHPGDPDPAVRPDGQATDDVGGVHAFRAPTVAVERHNRVAAEVHGPRPVLDCGPGRRHGAGVPGREDAHWRHPSGSLLPSLRRGAFQSRGIPGGNPEENAARKGAAEEQRGGSDGKEEGASRTSSWHIRTQKHVPGFAPSD